MLRAVVPLLLLASALARQKLFATDEDGAALYQIRAANKEAFAPGQSELAQVQAHLEAPSALPYDFSPFAKPGREEGYKGEYLSQEGQDKWVDGVFNGATGLFVVESGANNGFSLSNSMFLEFSRKWQCLLVEANPQLQEAIGHLHRRCHLLKGGLSITKDIGSFSFKLAGPLGGFTSTESADHEKRAESEIKSSKPWMKGEQGSGEVVSVDAFPLHLAMKALGRSTIDYWSLDTEGSELAILKGTDFSQMEIGVMSIEHNGDLERKEAIRKVLEPEGILSVKDGPQDDFYASKTYFEKRGLLFPR